MNKLNIPLISHHIASSIPKLVYLTCSFYTKRSRITCTFLFPKFEFNLMLKDLSMILNPNNNKKNKNQRIKVKSWNFLCAYLRKGQLSRSLENFGVWGVQLNSTKATHRALCKITPFNGALFW